MVCRSSARHRCPPDRLGAPNGDGPGQPVAVPGLGPRATTVAAMPASVFVVAVVFAGLVFGVPMDAIGRCVDSVMFIDVMRSAQQMSGVG